MDDFYIDNYKRVWGNAHIDGDVTIHAANKTLTIQDENIQSYTISLTEGFYHTEYTKNSSELIEELNKQFRNNSLPIEALLGGYHKDEKYNTVVLRMTNERNITEISGSFCSQFLSA